jgi:hypothetical protein
VLHPLEPKPQKGKELTYPTFWRVELAKRLTLSGPGLMVHVFRGCGEGAMPDGDMVHGQLGQRYQNPYKILCEGVASSEECAHKVLAALRKDLQKNSGWPLYLLREIANLLSNCIGPLEFSNDIQASRISLQMDEWMRQADGPPREKELIARTSKSVLNELRHGLEMDTSNFKTILVERYILETLEANFKHKIPLSGDHYNGVSNSELGRRIKAMEPHLSLGIRQFAQNASKNHCFDKLRLPIRDYHRGIDLNEDLLVSHA